MAIIDLVDYTKPHTNQTSMGAAARFPYLVDRTIDLAEVVKKKGSPLVVGDEIVALLMPPNIWQQGIFVFAPETVNVAGTEWQVSIDWPPAGGGSGRLDIITDWSPDQSWITGYSNVNTPGGRGGSKFNEWVTIRLTTASAPVTSGQIQLGLIAVDITPRAVPEIAQMGS